MKDKGSEKSDHKISAGEWTIHGGVFYARSIGDGIYSIGCDPGSTTRCATKGNLCYAPGHGMWEVLEFGPPPSPPVTFSAEEAVLIDPNYQMQL